MGNRKRDVLSPIVTDDLAREAVKNDRSLRSMSEATMTEPEKQNPEPSGKTKFLYDDYTSQAEWAARPPIAPSDRPIYLPRE
jgi:hypothetical protein